MVKDQYLSRAVEKAMLALDCIRQSPQPLSLMEISAVLGLTKASAFRLLYTLEALHYLSKSADGRYFAPPHFAHHDLVRHGSASLERLSMEYGETVSLAALFENHIEVMVVFESSQLMRMGNTPGRILPPNASSMGKAITAFQPPEITEKLVRSYGMHRFTPHTIVDEIALRDEFAEVRERGFAEDVEESVVGGRCFAAPILRANGFAVGAVSLSMPMIRFRGEEQRQVILGAVRETAKGIEGRI
ncbi:MAG: IclR family transcriptional regulator [Bryobacteraceae bacterium]